MLCTNKNNRNIKRNAICYEWLGHCSTNCYSLLLHNFIFPRMIVPDWNMQKFKLIELNRDIQR